MIKKILVAIDGSKHADQSLDYAIDLAKRYSAKITVLTVINSPPNYLLNKGEVFTPVSTQELSKKIENYHKKILKKALEKVKKTSKKTVISQKLLTGRPADKIIETAKEENFDLIVIGSRGLGGIKQFLLGSVSDRVADEAPIPVLIIKDPKTKLPIPKKP
jgi:nucleotide-binding universal stress UspA family protein